MLSRRNVRIKVMQMLYSMSRDKELTLDDAMKRYRDRVRKSFEMYLYSLLFLIKVAEYARKDVANKRAKLLPSEEDKKFTARLVDNPAMESIIKNVEVIRLFTAYKLEERIPEDTVRSLYQQFTRDTEGYKAFATAEEVSEEEVREILLRLLKLFTSSEVFNELLEDNYPQWVDDSSLVTGSLKKTIKALPAESDFYEAYRPSREATIEFGEVLLSKVVREDAELLEIIEPNLNNWDADRVAIIDMILIKMAICELLNFPSIPTKVTLNEFVEIAKMYSTDKSKDFINGILDRLMKKLEEDGKLNKKGRDRKG